MALVGVFCLHWIGIRLISASAATWKNGLIDMQLKSWRRHFLQRFRRATMRALLAVVIVTASVLPASAADNNFAFSTEVTTFGTQTDADFTMWLPDDRETIRGMALIMPGSCGDARLETTFPQWQVAANSLGFGLIASEDRDFGHANNQGCWWGAFGGDEPQQNLQRVLDRAAEVSGHTEITNAPVLPSGNSQGGFNAWLIGTHAPSKVIGYTSIRGFAPAVNLPQESREVPGIFLVGSLDAIVPPQNATYPGFVEHREHGALVAFAPEWTRGHDSGQSTWEMGWYWMSEVTQLRYPADQQPSSTPGQPVALQGLDPSAAWLGEAATFLPGPNRFTAIVTASAHPEVNPVATYTGDPLTASWLPTEAFAHAYRARTLIDPSRPLVNVPGQFHGGPMQFVSPKSFVPANIDRAFPPETLQVGETIDVEVDPRQFDDAGAIVSMQFFDGDLLIGEDTEGPEWSIPFRPSSAGIRGLIAVATNDAGEQTSAFRAVVVEPVIVAEPSSLLLLALVTVAALCCRTWPPWLIRMWR